MTRTLSGVQMIALTLVLALAMTFTLQRVARAGDTEKIVGAVVAGIILHELLDDDDTPRWQRGPVWYGPRKSGPPVYDYRGYDRGPAWGPPAYHPYDRGRPGVQVDVRRGPHGRTSVGLRYRDYHR